MQRLLSLALVIPLLGPLSAQTLTSDDIPKAATKTPIRRVVFQNANLLSLRARRDIIRSLRTEITEPDSPVLDPSICAEEIAELVRAAYQNDGYFKVEVDASPIRVRRDSANKYDVIVQVLKTGKQYRLSDLDFVHVKAFPEPQLRNLFPIQRGEIFSREKIAIWLENLRGLYSGEGYLNFTSVPSISFDDKDSIVDLHLDIDEGRLFHWGDLHADGMRDQDRQILLKAWGELRGRPYRSGDQQIAQFVQKFFLPLRKGENLADCAFKKFDSVDGTVDVFLTFVWIPETLKSAAVTPEIVAE